MTAPPPVPSAAPSLQERFRASPAVWTLGSLNVAAFLWLSARGGPVNAAALLDAGALVVPLVPDEPWRLLTSTFLHFSWFHLASNLFGLAIFGPAFERLVGTSRFVALWLAAGLAGSAATVLSASGLTIAAGASGSVFGLMGAFLFIGLRTRHTPAGAIRLRQALVLLLINLGFGLMDSNIGLAAHVGGTIAGVVILSMYAVPRPRPGDQPPPPNRNRGLPQAILVGAASVVLALTTGPSF